MPMGKFSYSLYFILISTHLLSCQQPNYPVAAVDPVTNIAVVNEHSEFLIDWMKQGYKDMVLVHIDEHDDFRYIPEYKMKQLETLYKNKKWDEIDSGRDKANGLFSIADFLYPAYKLGIIKKLYWIPTTDKILSYKLQTHAQELIDSWDYADDIADAFHKEGNTLRGNIYGLDIIITSLYALPEIKDPVLLSIDIDYFSDVIKDSKSDELDVIKDFFSKLMKKNLKIKRVNIAYSTNSGHTPITDRHFCEEIIYCFQHPEILDKWNVPEIWTVRNRGFGLIRQDQPEDAMKFFRGYLSRYTNEPTLLLGKAISLSLTGKNEEASHTISRLLQSNPEYDHVYIYLCKILEEKGENQLAQQYFRKYFKRHPDYYSWVFNNK
jgi:tetratricopeptide (TPR) repeat protein